MNRENHTYTTGKDYGPIVGVAIVYDGHTYSLPKPNRHHNVIRYIASLNGVGIRGPDTQGFIDANGNFLNRTQALVVAAYHNQILDINSVRANELFSEDLW